MLEKQMLEMRELPERVTKLELQIMQLRHEMRDEFSATRSELRTEFRTELRGSIDGLRDELRADIVGAVHTLSAAILETNTQMRVLHEEALARIATVGEGLRPGRKKRPKSR